METVGADTIAVKLPLQQAQAGVLTLQLTPYGVGRPQAVQLHAFSEAGHLSSFTLRAGDTQGILRGTRLDEVASMALKGMVLLPGKLSSSSGVDELPMMLADALTAVALKQGDAGSAKVTLKDGRALDLNIVVDAPRPRVTLIGKNEPPPSGSGSNIRLAAQDELPHDARLIFSLRTQSPAAFTYDEKIEVATVNNASSAILSFDNGGITLEDAQVAVAVLDPPKTFGSSAFGPLQFRVTARDAAGDWQPLATLVRLPVLNDLKCPASRELACKLSGSSLFLVDSVAGDPQFEHSVQVPDGFPGYALPVPRPADGTLYVKLRDDPSVVNASTLVAQQLPPSSDELALAAARRAAANSEHDSAAGDATVAPPAPAAPSAAIAPTAPAH